MGATDNQSDSDAADDNTPQGPSPWDAWLDGTDDNATTGNADDNAEVANDGGSPQGPAPWDCWLDGEEPNAVASDQYVAISFFLCKLFTDNILPQDCSDSGSRQ